MAAASRRSTTSAATTRTVVEMSRVSFGLMPTLSFAPHEQARHRVVPDHAHQGSGSARQPPDRLLVVDREGDADIGKQADTADDVEQQQAAHECKTLQPLVAIGE